MPSRKEYTSEFKDQAVRFVLEEIEPDESRKHACERLAPKLSVKAVTLYNWLKQSSPGKARPAAPPSRSTACSPSRAPRASAPLTWRQTGWPSTACTPIEPAGTGRKLRYRERASGMAN